MQVRKLFNHSGINVFSVLLACLPHFPLSGPLIFDNSFGISCSFALFIQIVVQPRFQLIPLLLDDTPERLSCLENELNDLDKP